MERLNETKKLLLDGYNLARVNAMLESSETSMDQSSQDKSNSNLYLSQNVSEDFMSDSTLLSAADKVTHALASANSTATNFNAGTKAKEFDQFEHNAWSEINVLQILPTSNAISHVSKNSIKSSSFNNAISSGGEQSKDKDSTSRDEIQTQHSKPTVMSDSLINLKDPSHHSGKQEASLSNESKLQEEQEGTPSTSLTSVDLSTVKFSSNLRSKGRPAGTKRKNVIGLSCTNNTTTATPMAKKPRVAKGKKM